MWWILKKWINLNKYLECYSEFELPQGKYIKEEDSNYYENCKTCINTSCYDNIFLQIDIAICIKNCEKGYYKQSEHLLNYKLIWKLFFSKNFYILFSPFGEKKG